MAVYKAKIYSYDGQTLINGNYRLFIPNAKANGAGTSNASTIARDTAGKYFDAIRDSTGPTLSTRFRNFAYYFCATNQTTRNVFLSEMGFNITDLYGMLGGFVPFRMVFEDGRYCGCTFFERNEYAGMQVSYYKADGTLVTGPITVSVGASTRTGATADAWGATFPFVVTNEDGTVTDYMARSTTLYAYHVSGLQPWIVKVQNNLPIYLENHNYNLREWWEGLEPIDIDDPYVDIPNSLPSGPAEGVGIPQTANIDIPTLPSVSAVDTGFIELFNPTLTQVKDLADYMWAGLFDIATFKKIFADPMDCILGFNVVPVDVPTGYAATVTVGNISTGVSMNTASGQWVELNCGSVNIDLPYGSYLDYAPYSKVSLYLPYIGMVELSTDDVMGRTLTLAYHVDILSCACVAYLKCGPDVLYQFTGSCGYSIPITGENFRQMISNIIGIAATIGGAVVSGGAAAPVVTASMTAKQAAKAAAKAAAMKQAHAMATIGAAESVAQTVMASKPDVHRSGALGSSAGLMGIQKPFIIMELPNACKPEKQYHYTGYPGFITVKVGDLTGFAEFESIILDGIPCTEDERDQIAALCAGGIYL